MGAYGPAFDAMSIFVRSSGVCADCKRRFPPSELDAHHKVPRQIGGSDAYSNLVALCASCHASREASTRATARLLTRRQPVKLRKIRSASPSGRRTLADEPSGHRPYGP